MIKRIRVLKHGGNYVYHTIYDINVKRVSKVHKFLKSYLTWIQNSVFEGEISKANYKKVTMKLKELINPNEDSIIIYNMPYKYLHRNIIGIEKNPIELII